MGTSRYRAALITGATSGIGAAFARALPAETDLLLTGRRADRLERLSAELARQGRRVETVAADLSQPSGIDAVVAAAEAFGLDLLVNNAGLGRFGPFLEDPVEAEYAMVAVNVVAPLMLTRRLLPGMRQRAEAAGTRAGVILVASVVAFAGLPYASTYAATKAFDLRLAEGLAAEFVGTQVDVLALCPGTTDTEFFDQAGIAPRPGHSPERVARDGLAALGRRRVHVVGAANHGATVALRLLPRELIGWAAGRAMGRRR